MTNQTIITEIPAGFVPDYFLYFPLIIAILSVIGLTYAYKSKKTNWGNFGQVIIFTILIAGIITWGIATMPEVFFDWIEKLKGVLI